jgi:hypothetical protein
MYTLSVRADWLQTEEGLLFVGIREFCELLKNNYQDGVFRKAVRP